ncbi:MAG: ATP-binding protein [Parachlamydiales bacterium]|nr:ATP-binding protein [Parachlamydiales bacterium]
MLWRFYDIQDYIKPNKALIIYGPRRVGKTTLLSHFLNKTNLKYRLDSGDNIRIQQILSSQDFNLIKEYAEGYELIAIDEAQEIPNIGKSLKILVDQIPNIYVIATGSSSFQLSQNAGEPLTGRKNTLTLFPLAQLELLHEYNKFDLKEKLSDFLLFGSYPDVIIAKTKIEKITILKELVESYLLKDILAHEKLKGPQVLFNLLKLLAFQVGQLVSLSELATQLNIDVKTVGRYLDILQKSFVIYKLSGFSKNLRKEITTKSKYYFWDNGIRNGIISQFNDFDNRNDFGQLFENFIVMERMKKHSYKQFYGENYFWRTYDGQEIDLIETINNSINAYEIKSSVKNISSPIEWKNNYPNSSFEVINTENYLSFIMHSSR